MLPIREILNTSKEKEIEELIEDINGMVLGGGNKGKDGSIPGKLKDKVELIY